MSKNDPHILGKESIGKLLLQSYYKKVKCGKI